MYNVQKDNVLKDNVQKDKVLNMSAEKLSSPRGDPEDIRYLVRPLGKSPSDQF